MIYVDAAINHWKGKLWCHLTADSIAELHAFASQRLGLRKEWFQNHKLIPHYDITEKKRLTAIRYGAIALTTEERITEVKKRLREIRPRQSDVIDFVDLDNF